MENQKGALLLLQARKKLSSMYGEEVLKLQHWSEFVCSISLPREGIKSFLELLFTKKKKKSNKKINTLKFSNCFSTITRL